MIDGVVDEKVIAELYAHIGNSGYTFKVVDNGYGAEFSLEYASLGITSQKTNVKIDTDSLREIGEMFVEASKAEFSENKHLGTASLHKYSGRESREGTEDGEDVVETTKDLKQTKVQYYYENTPSGIQIKEIENHLVDTVSAEKFQELTGTTPLQGSNGYIYLDKEELKFLKTKETT